MHTIYIEQDIPELSLEKGDMLFEAVENSGLFKFNRKVESIDYMISENINIEVTASIDFLQDYIDKKLMTYLNIEIDE